MEKKHETKLWKSLSYDMNGWEKVYLFFVSSLVWLHGRKKYVLIDDYDRDLIIIFSSPSPPPPHLVIVSWLLRRKLHDDKNLKLLFAKFGWELFDTKKV